MRGDTGIFVQLEGCSWGVERRSGCWCVECVSVWSWSALQFALQDLKIALANTPSVHPLFVLYCIVYYKKVCVWKERRISRAALRRPRSFLQPPFPFVFVLVFCVSTCARARWGGQGGAGGAAILGHIPPLHTGQCAGPGQCSQASESDACTQALEEWEPLLKSDCGCA